MLSELLVIKIKRITPGAMLPVKATLEAGAYDVYARKIEKLPDGMVICYLGFSTEIPEGWRSPLIPRSSISNYGWILANFPLGVIDSDFRNEWQARFRPLPIIKTKKRFFGLLTSTEIVMPEFPYKEGERVAQIYFDRVNDVVFNETNTLKSSGRDGGFESTGKK